MDDLLDRTGAAFLAGEATPARGAYRMLLEGGHTLNQRGGLESADGRW
jgi:hypothetical protein